MRRILLHLGLHKTGMTAAQSFLHENRELVWPRFALVLPYKTRKSGLSEAATRHSIYRLDATLAGFGGQIQTFLDGLDFGERRGLILSEENFLGLRPSRNREEGYGAAPELAETLVSVLRRRLLGDEVDITVYLSLRQREAWLRSLWAHDLHQTRIVQDLDGFCSDLAHLPTLQETADTIRDRLPTITVETAFLEQVQNHPLGAGAPFANFLDLPPEKAALLRGPARVSPSFSDEVLQEMLSLNRSSLDEAALITQKKALIQTAQTELARQT
ncbi:hypothetical protein GS636_19670 [Ruegeria sp. HKCCD4884]|uniref:hypothetical protein n=1 Tax=Ruegeria sp. HKCCD4884 TaxID=2683022 RepID=UPI0014911788|nr:hypothetical protein [Ruegeria sp. HKCCD4884]NOD95020.1 hypothetical protein [Ruegeria sp. HKCCD4884]